MAVLEALACEQEKEDIEVELNSALPLLPFLNPRALKKHVSDMSDMTDKLHNVGAWNRRRKVTRRQISADILGRLFTELSKSGILRLVTPTAANMDTRAEERLQQELLRAGKVRNMVGGPGSLR